MLFNEDIHPDQHVSHIIARAHGGADHPSNYDYVRGRAWNQMTQHRFDHIHCFLAGLSKCEKAVAISQELGSYTETHPKHKKYTGPSALELYTRGQAAMEKILS